MKVKRICAASLVLCITAGMLSAMPASAQEGEAYITHNIPTTMKIGDIPSKLPDPHIYYCNFAPETWLYARIDVDFKTPSGDNLQNGYNGRPEFYFGQHSGTDPFMKTDENGTSELPSIYGDFGAMDAIYIPGTLTVQYGYQEYLKEGRPESSYNPTDWSEKKIAGSVVVQIEEPVIQTNTPEVVKAGSSLDFSTELTNTALENKNNAYYLDENNYESPNDPLNKFLISKDGYDAHDVAYQPSVEIIEGQEIVQQSDQDYSNTLKSSEKLTFTGTGTVKLRVTYNQIVTCGSCLSDTGTYSPEKVVTIQVTEDGQLPEADKDGLQNLVDQNSGLTPEDYTKDSYQSYLKALEQANAILNDPNATQEEIDQAIRALEEAVAGLILTATENASDTTGPEPNSDIESDKPAADNEIDSGPETGDNYFAILSTLTLAGVSTVLLVTLGVRRKMQK